MRSQWESRGRGIACDVGIADGIYRHTAAAIGSAPAQIRRIHQGGASWIQFHQIGIGVSTTRSLKARPGDGKAQRLGPARQISATVRVNSHPFGRVIVFGSDVG